MFSILNFFTKKRTLSIPTIKTTKEYKIDNRKQHNLFLIELENILKISEFFKPKYVNKYLILYKKYKPFIGKDTRLIYQQNYFFESLNEPEKYKKSEYRRYAKNLVSIANRRSVHRTNLDRYSLTGISKVQIVFTMPNNKCPDMIRYRKALNNQTLLLSQVDLFPLKTCIKCSECFVDVMYRPLIEL